MANLNALASIVSELRAERTNLVDQLKHVDAALSVLGKLDGGNNFPTPRRRAFSASTRRKMRLAQKARWAKKTANIQPKTTKPKSTLSAAGRKRIAEFQRARWAKWKAQQKKAA
jgi:hypothetical protein